MKRRTMTWLKAVAVSLSCAGASVVAGSTTGQGPATAARSGNAEAEVMVLLEKDQPFTLVPAPLFNRLGWPLPDGGAAVKALATAAPGGAFDPKALEALSPDKLGYRARWHAHRYTYYGLPWDITGLYLEPIKPASALPVLVYINGGSANFYEFFVDPLNNPGLGQYLAQRIPVLLVSIPGNYRHGGWPDPIPQRRPQYVLDRDLGDGETRLRNAIFTNTLIAEGLTRLIDAATRGPVLISGHSTSGELQYILKERLNDRLRGFSFGWGTGGPAWVRGSWEGEAADARNRGAGRKYPAVTEVRARDAQSYSGGYLGPLNPIAGGSRLEIAQKWLDLESRRRPWFKQAIQDIEHTASVDLREEVERTIRQVVASSKRPVDAEAVIKDLFATMRSPITGYRRMVWTAAMLDDGHWDPDPAKARELFVANRFREKNPGAVIRVLVYDVPMTHYGHIERPKELAGGTLAAVKWLVK